MLLTWLKFVLTAAVVYWGSKHLTQVCDDLAEALGLTKGWVGLIFLSAVTSLPEAATSGSAIAMGEVDIAIGNVLGSNIFNLTFVGILALFTSSACMWKMVGFEQVLNCIWLIGLTLLAIFGFFVPLAWGGISLASILILVFYLVGAHYIYAYHKTLERTHIPNSAGEKRALYGRLFLFALVVVGAGFVLATSAKDIVQITGLSNTFVGSFFAAIVTSLPEVTVSFHAVKMGEVDMAIGNLLGSDVFNTALIFFMELLSLKSGVFVVASSSHLLTCLSILALTGIALYAIHYALPDSFLIKASPWVMSIIYFNYLWFLI